MKALDELIQYVRELRDEKTGCTWTRSQTWKTLAPQTLDECYELIDAINTNNPDAITHELSDLLYHVVLYATISEENNSASLEELARATLDKHYARMPPKALRATLTPEETNRYWQQQKRKQQSSKTAWLDSVSNKQPALLQANKLQTRAAEVGFDWAEVEPVLHKIEEELAELRMEIEQPTLPRALEEELGDLLFACVNLARHLKIDPEIALRYSNEKFTRRFNYIETRLANEGKTLRDASLDDMETYWEASKKNE